MSGARTTFSLAIGVAISLCAGGLAHANPADVFGFGSRGASMGGAATALAIDGSANYYNPAGLARGTDLRIDIGYQAGKPWLTLNGRDIGVDATHGLTAAIVAPGKIFGARFAFGAAIFLPDDRLTRSRSLPFAQPRFVYYDNRTQRIYLPANIALALPGHLYIGGGMTFMARTAGTVELQGTLGIADPDGDSRLVSAINVDLLAVRYPQAGIVWEATRWLTFGASYRGSFLLQIDQGFDIVGNVGNPGVTPLVSNGALTARTVSADLFQPWQVTVGTAARITRRLLLSFDLQFARWSEFQTPAATVTVNLDLGPQLNPLVHVAPPAPFPAPGFHDILIPRLGVELRALERQKWWLDLRAGFAYEPTPVPEQSGTSNYADGDKYTVSIGAGITLDRIKPYLPRAISFDGHVAATFLAPSSARKIDPTDPVGDWVAAGTVLAGGVTMRLAF